MEELSIEEKAKAYDEAINKIMDYRKGNTKMYSDVNKAIDYLFPELKESEDERIRKRLIEEMRRFQREAARQSCDADFEFAKSAIAWLEKQGEQNLAGKVEAKFHEGDWIIHQGTENIYQVVAVIDNQYQLKYGDNYTIQYCEDVERCARLWDVAKDAKDGDVLVASDGSIFLFKETVDNACKHYVALTTDGAVKFNEGLEHYWETSTAVHPATKEQRDILMKAMHEASYEWNAEKKESKKIEQNFTWSEDDERISSNINLYIRKAGDYPHFGKENIKEARNWMNALKDRVQH